MTIEHQTENALKLAELIISHGLPDKNSSTRVLRLPLSIFTQHSPDLREALNILTSEATKSKDRAVREQHKNCLNHIINSLIVCIFRFEWLALPSNESNFIEGSHYQTLGFSRRRIVRCIDVLTEAGLLISGRKGFRSGTTLSSKGKSSQFFASEVFIRKACELLYVEAGEFENTDNNSLYQFKRFEEEDLPSLSEYEHKVQIIRDYNHFMLGHSWAMKSPSHRSIKDFDCRSGRIINMYQSLANRRIPIRTNTLLDGYEISEPDFSANHLRMAAYLLDHDLPADPYTEIAEEVRLSREQVKYLVTRCLGATKLLQKGGIIVSSPKQRVSIPLAGAKAAIAAFIDHYPWLVDVFFNDFGARLQYLEGEIGLGMLQWSVKEAIPLVAVHDAYAVRNIDTDKTYQKMHEVWHMVLAEAKKNDFLAKSSHTTELVYLRNKGGLN